MYSEAGKTYRFGFNGMLRDDDIKDLGNFKRKVRNEINKLEKEGFIIRKSSNKPDYKINKDFGK